MLEDARGFAKWWVEQVGALARDGMTPHYIELMNEPDSMGHWSTGIAPATYNSVVKGFRDALRIAYQNRPHLFARRIELPELLSQRVIEVDERMSAEGEALRPVDLDAAKRELKEVYD